MAESMTAPGDFTIHARDGQARRATLVTAHGEIQTPVFMPVGTQGSVKAGGPRRPGKRARADHSRQHLPPLPAPRRRTRGPARRSAPLRQLEKAHPHRLRGISGLQPGHDPDHQRKGRGVPVLPRRLQAFFLPGESGFHSAEPRLGHHDGPGRVRWLRRGPRIHRPLPGADHPLGAALPRGPRSRPKRPASLRHRPGRILRGSAR